MRVCLCLTLLSQMTVSVPVITLSLYRDDDMIYNCITCNESPVTVASDSSVTTDDDDTGVTGHSNVRTHSLTLPGPYHLSWQNCFTFINIHKRSHLSTKTLFTLEETCQHDTIPLVSAVIGLSKLWVGTWHDSGNILTQTILAEKLSIQSYTLSFIFTVNCFPSKIGIEAC